MKIAQVAPLIESIPPRLYGGSERIASYLTEALVAEGHDVTLFASGDSMTGAELVPCAEHALRLDPRVKDPIPYYMIMLDRVRAMANEFDILHFHIDQFHFPIFRPIADHTLTTLHGRQDLPDLKILYEAFPEMPLVSISNDQRRPIPHANFLATIYHGLPAALHDRISSRAAVISPSSAGLLLRREWTAPSKLLAVLDCLSRSRPRWTRWIKRTSTQRSSRCSIARTLNSLARSMRKTKTRFLGEASALLFPIDWPEPFGLVMIEAMACGTPVLAFARGSVPEVIDEGITGRIIASIDEAPHALQQVLAVDRRMVRRRFEQRFTAERMAREYVDTYEKLVSRRRSRTGFGIARHAIREPNVG